MSPKKPMQTDNQTLCVSFLQGTETLIPVMWIMLHVQEDNSDIPFLM